MRWWRRRWRGSRLDSGTYTNPNSDTHSNSDPYAHSHSDSDSDANTNADPRSVRDVPGGDLHG